MNQNEENKLVKQEDYVKISDIEVPSAIDRLGASKSKNGSISIINSKNNGRRINISKKILGLMDTEDLKIYDCDEISVGFLDDGLILSKVKSVGKLYKVKNGKNAIIIYNSALVQEITSKFNLNFDSVVCLTFSKFTIVNLLLDGEESKAIKFTMK